MVCTYSVLPLDFKSTILDIFKFTITIIQVQF